MQTPPTRMIRFSTDDFPPHERLEAYREIYGRTIIRHDIEPLGDEPFRFEASLCSLPGLGLSTSILSPCRRSHGRQHLDSDDLILGFGLTDAGCVVHQHGREAVIRQGQAVLTSAAHPVDVLIPKTSRPVSLRLPRAILTAGVANVDACVARPILERTAVLRLLADYIGAIGKADILSSPDLVETCVPHVHDLAVLILGAKRDARELAEQRGLRAARLAAVLRAIESGRSEPTLSAVVVARALGVTPRYVHRLLEETGRSFTHHLLERRLEKAAALLRDQRWRERRISDIASEAGFTDLSYFNRAFHRRFGMTPSDMRVAAWRSHS
jgi:AraC-like DNA-binding protein